MVNGLQRFIEYFNDYQDQYVIIGGYACTLHYYEKGISFRQTHDLDIVLIIEKMTSEYYTKLWNYLEEGGYVSELQTSQNHHYYRFATTNNKDYPRIIELLSRKAFELDAILSQHITPIHIDEKIRSLSAIVLDDDYYHLIRMNQVLIRGISVLSIEFIVILKIKAYLDLRELREKGVDIKSSQIRKHRTDVLRIVREIVLIEVFEQIGISIKNDILIYIRIIQKEMNEKVNLGFDSGTINKIFTRTHQVYIGDDINIPHL
jgi:hypothetical protein